MNASKLFNKSVDKLSFWQFGHTTPFSSPSKFNWIQRTFGLLCNPFSFNNGEETGDADMQKKQKTFLLLLIVNVEKSVRDSIFFKAFRTGNQTLRVFHLRSDLQPKDRYKANHAIKK